MSLYGNKDKEQDSRAAIASGASTTAIATAKAEAIVAADTAATAADVIVDAANISLDGANATLPTSDPGVAGALWADTLAVKVSAG